MSVTEVAGFISYFETLLQQQVSAFNPSTLTTCFKSFAEADEFLEGVISSYKSTDANSFRRSVLRTGLHSEKSMVKEFFAWRLQLKNSKRSERRALLDQTGLSGRGSADSTSSIRIIYLSKLKTAYPPMGHWVADNETIYTQWERYLQHYKLSDARHKRYPTALLDTSHLQLDVLPHESVIIYDADTREIIGVVLRNFANHTELLEWATDILRKSTELSKSVRLSDPGKICLQGWTAGQLSNPRFDWVKNMTKVLDSKELEDHHEAICSVFAVCWNLALRKHPKAIIHSFEEFMHLVNPPRMKYNAAIPGFTIKINGQEHRFTNQSFAPPSGQSGSNYARYIYRETNATRYMLLWNTDRRSTSPDDSIACGGNFFLADYGVRIQNASDTSIAWEPKAAHGTSLMEKGNTFFQIGLAMGISKRLGSIWEKYRSGGPEDGNMLEEVEKEFITPEECTEVIEEGEIVD